MQERFYKLWEHIAKRYAVSDGSIAFELLNEVTEQSYKDIWNSIIKNCIERIRRIAPDTYILVGGYWQNSPDAVPDLEVPYDDKVIYNFHCYDPLMFTHQGAYWVENMDKNFRLPFDDVEPPITPEFSLKGSAGHMMPQRRTELFYTAANTALSTLPSLRTPSNGSRR